MQHKINIAKLHEEAIVPRKQTELATGFDLHACLNVDSITISTSPQLIPTGIAIEIPYGLDVQIRPRSGLTAKGIIAGYGTIDADYRGELFVTLYCLESLKEYTIENHDRIAQLIISKTAPINWEIVNSLDKTSRGNKGHGSTGRK
ncbi:MAG: dUTP pyrophosphatase [Chloroflexi bacterium]|jgi:dUTP pyrophosphatase|nr:MAG: dUTP pyrophosphatase [Chloroflexota bacterium]|tara:strand:- start:2570 stop:3007 length:438 start_codon:yes stop_codon:yes gene_type:complete